MIPFRSLLTMASSEEILPTRYRPCSEGPTNGQGFRGDEFASCAASVSNIWPGRAAATYDSKCHKGDSEAHPKN